MDTFFFLKSCLFKQFLFIYLWMRWVFALFEVRQVSRGAGFPCGAWPLGAQASGFRGCTSRL